MAAALASSKCHCLESRYNGVVFFVGFSFILPGFLYVKDHITRPLSLRLAVRYWTGPDFRAL